MAAVNQRRLPILAGVFVLIPLLGIIYLLGAPSLESVSPAAGATEVAASEPLRLTFSDRMYPTTIEERLVIDPPVPGKTYWEGSTLIYAPQRPWPGGKPVQVKLRPGSRRAGLLPFSILEEATWSFTVAEPRLAYLYPADGLANLYALNARTGDVEQLTDFQGGLQDYSVSASGSIVYFSVGNSQGGSDIYRLDLLGVITETGQVTRTPALVLDCPQASCRNPRVSPGGDLLAYERSGFLGSNEPGYTRVWLLPLDDNGLAQATPAGQATEKGTLAGAADHQTLLPAWSSLGVLAYYDTTQSAFVFLDPDNGQTRLLKNQTGQAGAWEPSGRFFLTPEISFLNTSAADSAGLQAVASSHLMQFSMPDGMVSDLTRAENLEDTSPAYSPDGTLVALARKYLDLTRWTPGRQLWLMNAEGGEARPLTLDPFYNHYDFAWDPSGKWLAYVRFNQTLLTEPPEIWVVDLVTDRARQVVTGGYSPQWIP